MTTTYIEKIQDTMQKHIDNGEKVFFCYNKNRKEFYVTTREGIAVFAIPEDEFRLHGEPNVFKKSNLEVLWDKAESENSYLVKSQEKVKKNGKTLWKFEADNNYFLCQAYIQTRSVTELGIGGKKKKFNIYIGGRTRVVLFYTMEDTPKRVAMVCPFIINE